MSENVFLWLAQVAVLIILGLIGLYVRSLVERLAEIKNDLEHKIEKLEIKLTSQDEHFTRWRHHTYGPLMAEIQLRGIKTEEKVAQIEKWKNGKVAPS